MNEIAVFLLILAGFPVLIGSRVFLAVTATRRASSFDCPHCFRRIPKATFVEGLPCPYCDHSPAGTSEQPPTDSTLGIAEDNECCARCASTLEGISSLQLWDGKQYCHDCVALKNPDLFEYARTNDGLQETMPHSPWSISAAMFVLTIKAFVGFGAAISVLALCVGQGNMALPGFAAIMVIGAPVIVLWSTLAGLAFNASRPVVTVREGRLILRMGMQVVVAPLSACKWSAGRSSQITVLPYGFLLHGPAIVVEIPRPDAKQRNRLAVGFTDETFIIWYEFFNFCAVPQLSAKGK